MTSDDFHGSICTDGQILEKPLPDEWLYRYGENTMIEGSMT
jgi:hypothetical protein